MNPLSKIKDNLDDQPLWVLAMEVGGFLLVEGVGIYEITHRTITGPLIALMWVMFFLLLVYVPALVRSLGKRD